MRILVINQSDLSGGAAIAASRLCKGLEQLYGDVETFFSVGLKLSSDPNVFCTRKNFVEQYVEMLVNRVTSMLGLQYFWFPFSTTRILRQVRKVKPHIIYLRNIHGGYFKTSLLKNLSSFAPIVWTLSDMWSFTGHCAHSFGDMSWNRLESGCPDRKIYPAIGINTGKWLLRRKRHIYQQTNITIVTPSRWLYRLAKQTPVFKGKEILQIYNGFDLKLFKPKNKHACRADLGIPASAKVLMFSADRLKKNSFKGGQDLIEILASIDKKTSETIHLLIAGQQSPSRLPSFRKLFVHHLGYVENEEVMTKCYSASDLLIYPTRADNLPNILIEAISCGTPCVTFGVGGCGEIIQNRVNGFVVTPFDIDKFASFTVDALGSNEALKTMSQNARKIAEEKFTLEKMCHNYYRLFSRLAAGGCV